MKTNKKLLPLILLTFLMLSSDLCAVVIVPATKKQEIYLNDSETRSILADGFVSCGNENTYDDYTYPTGEGCMHVFTKTQKKEGDWIKTETKIRKLITYRDMVKSKGEFAGIQIIHKYSGSNRYPFVYVFYKTAPQKVLKNYYLICGEDSKDSISVPKIIPEKNFTGCEIVKKELPDRKSRKVLMTYQEMVGSRGKLIKTENLLLRQSDGSLKAAVKVIYQTEIKEN